jgi:hypothetical protein
MRRLLTDFPNSEALDILRNTVSAMGPESRLLIAEMLIPDRAIAGQAVMVYAIDLGLMAISGGQRTLDEYRGIIEQAGLRLVKVHERQDSYNVMLEARLNA